MTAIACGDGEAARLEGESLMVKCEKLCGKRGVHKFETTHYSTFPDTVTCECMPPKEGKTNGD